MRPRNLVIIALISLAAILATVKIHTPTPAPTATATVRPMPTKPVSDYIMAQLARWYGALRDVNIPVQGVVGNGLDERAQRIKIRMLPRCGAREEMEAALSTIDVPRDAFDVKGGVLFVDPPERLVTSVHKVGPCPKNSRETS